MASSVQSTSLFTLLIPLRRYSKFSPKTFHLTTTTTTKDFNFELSCSSSPHVIPHTEEQLLQAIADYDGKDLPCVRTYENDLAQLTLVGAVDFHQALTAAAADGGEVAAEHVNSGMDAMVVETMLPGPSGEHSTVSTRLFLPARKVKEKANKLKKTLSKEIFSGTARNILAMTFRQVVLQQLWNFDMIVFQPGEERKMDDLETPREVAASFALSSSDEYLISKLAEAFCIAALQNTQREFLNNLEGGNRIGFFHWFHKPEKIQSKDSSVFLYKLFEDEIVENARSLLDKYNLVKDSIKPVRTKSMHSWWKPSFYEKLEKIGGSDFSAWVGEYVPTYRLEIDAEVMGDAKIEGWKKSAENRWEVLLTHSQMVRLAEILDMYSVDPYSLFDKQLSCGVTSNFAKVSNKKGSSSLLKLLSVTLASGIFLVAITALGQICLPRFYKQRKHPVEHRTVQSSEVTIIKHDNSLDATKVQDFCKLAVVKVKDAFGWSDDIKVEDGIGIYIGELPAYLRGEDVATLATSSDNLDAHAKVSSMQDIASYQVVFSEDGKIVGFQPLSRVAVNQWAANPLAKELYGRKKLSPGIIEPGLKLSLPRNVIVLELLMSINPEAYFAVARPFQ